MRFPWPALVLLSLISAPTLALDAGQRVSTSKDPSPNFNRVVTKKIDLPDGPSGLVLGGKTLSDFLPSVDDDGNMTVLPGRKIGRVQNGKFILQSDAVQIQGSGSTGDISATSTRGAGGALRSMADRVNDVARPEDYRLPTDPDDTLSFQRAGATGRLLALSDLRPYTVCAATAVRRGVIGRGATIKPCASGFAQPRTTITMQTTGVTSSVPLKATSSIFYNTNWDASVLTDRGLVFDGFTVDLRGTSLATDGEFHAIKARMAGDVLIDGVTVYGGGDLSAFQATNGTIVRASRGFGFRNAGIDHWEGASNALVENNELVCSERYYRPDIDAVSGADGAVMFTGAGTDLSDHFGRNLTSRGNRISGGCNVGVFVNTLSPGSSLENVSSEGDLIDAAGNAEMKGIIYDGNIRGGRIVTPVLKNGNGPQAILLRPDVIKTSGADKTSGKPQRIQVTGPQVMDWSTFDQNYSPITLFGKGHVLTEAVVAGGANNTSVTVEDVTSTISGTFQPTSSSFGAVNCLTGCVNPGTVTSAGVTSIRAGAASTTWTPTVSCFGGSLGANSPPTARYSVNGKQVTARISHSIQNFGTCASGVLYTLPIAPAYDTAGSGRERSTGASLSVFGIQSAGAVLVQSNLGNTPTTTSGHDIAVTYEVQ